MQKQILMKNGVVLTETFFVFFFLFIFSAKVRSSGFPVSCLWGTKILDAQNSSE